ncbi:MAG: universal stress protein [Solirubrobacterales bacterium]|nr:universal stress protein [Solirubrobacterales bacterium]MBV9941956.1 universal stress protein [Solirubrobacterales bacterium]
MANATEGSLAQDSHPVSSDLIVSYDGTPNDDDALALGKLLARTGARLALAYIRHSREFDPRREELAQHDAERRLEQGVAWLGDPNIPRHVVFSGSTGEGLEQLAEAEKASVIVFGSDYRTSPGHAEPGTTAQRLLEGGSVAIAVAAAGLRSLSDADIEAIAVAPSQGDTAAQASAEALADKFGADIVELGPSNTDLIVVGSQASGNSQRIMLSGATRTMLNAVRGSVLVIPSGVPVRL